MNSPSTSLMTVVRNYSRTCVSAVYKLLFKGGVYFAQSSRLWGYSSRAAFIQRNTVFNNNITSIIQYFCLIQIIKVGLYVDCYYGWGVPPICTQTDAWLLCTVTIFHINKGPVSCTTQDMLNPFFCSMCSISPSLSCLESPTMVNILPASS